MEKINESLRKERGWEEGNNEPKKRGGGGGVVGGEIARKKWMKERLTEGNGRRIKKNVIKKGIYDNQ